MQMSKKTISLEELFYFGFFVFISIIKGFGFYEGQIVFDLLILPAFFCALCKIFLSAYTIRQWIMQIALLLLTGLVYYNSGERGILFIMFVILGMKHISIEKVFRIGLWVWSFCTIALSVFSFFRLEHTIYRVHEKMGLGHIFRWSLGFTHPNILHITYLALCAFIIYGLGKQYCLRHFVLLMAGNVLVFLYSVSYTGFGIVMLLLAGELYVSFRPRFCLAEKMLLNLVLPLCLIFSFALPLLLFDNPFAPLVTKLNLLLNTRIYLAHLFLSPEYISPFGVKIADIVEAPITMDNSYVWGMVNYGFILFALLMCAYLLLIADYTRKQKTRELVMIVCFLAAGFTEPLLFNTSFKNISLPFLGEFLYRQRDGAKEYALFPALPRTVDLSVPKWLAELPGWPKRAAAFGKKHLRQMAAAILAGALAGILLCSVLHTEPKGYVVQRFYTDGLYDKDSAVYLESADDPAYADYRVMNYKDAGTQMQVVEGWAARLESVRYYIGSVLIGGGGGYLLFLAVGYYFDRNRKRL